MALLDIDRNPSPKTLRTFGLLLALFLAIAGVLAWHREAGLAARILWGAAIIVPGIYFAWPAIRWPFYMTWITVVFPIGWLVSHLLLAVIFYGLVTPWGLGMRLLGRDPMHRKRDPRATSHWRPLRLDSDPARYFRQS